MAPGERAPSGWYCAGECEAFGAAPGYRVRECRVENAACAACALHEECVDNQCQCAFGFYEHAGGRCVGEALAVQFAVEARQAGPGGLPATRAAAEVGAPVLRALREHGVLAAGTPDPARVFRATFDGGAVWVCSLTLALADVRVGNLTQVARLEAALWDAAARGVFVLTELGVSTTAGSSFVRVHARGPGAVREAPSYGFRMVSRAYSAPRWDLRLRLTADSAAPSIALVLRRVRGVDMGGCPGYEHASADAAPCCVGALARAFHTTRAFARAAGGCVQNASAADALARRDYLEGALSGCERSHVHVRDDGLVDVVLFQDELEASAISTTMQGRVQTSIFDIGIAVLRPTEPGAFSVHVVTQRLTLQFTAAYSFTSVIAAGRVFTPVVNATLQRFFLPAPVSAARDFVRIDVQRRAALADTAEYSLVPASVNVDGADACAAWGDAARAAYAFELARAVGVRPACAGHPPAAAVCAGGASLLVPLPAGALDAGLGGAEAPLAIELLVRVRPDLAPDFLGRVAMTTRVAWDTVQVPCPDLNVLGDAQPLLSVGLYPAEAPAITPGTHANSTRVPAVATVLLAPPPAAFQRPGTETHALAAEHLVLVFLTSSIAARTVDRLLAAGTAWLPGTLEPSPAMLRICALEGAPGAARGPFGCHVRFAVFHGVVATGADHAVELTATPETSGWGLNASHGPAVAAHAEHVHTRLGANARFRRAYLVSTRGPDSSASELSTALFPSFAVRTHRLLVFGTAAVRGGAAPQRGAYRVLVPALVPARNPGFAEYEYLQHTYAAAYERVLGLAPGAGRVQGARRCAVLARTCTCFELVLRLPFPRSDLARHHAEALVRALADARSRTHARARAALSSALDPFFPAPVWLAAERARLPPPVLLADTPGPAPGAALALGPAFAARLEMADVNLADQMVYYYAASGGPPNRLRGRTVDIAFELPVDVACLEPGQQRAAFAARIDAPLRGAAPEQIQEIFVDNVLFLDDFTAFCGARARRLLREQASVVGTAALSPLDNTSKLVFEATVELAENVFSFNAEPSDNINATPLNTSCCGDMALAAVASGALLAGAGAAVHSAPPQLYPVPCFESAHLAFSILLLVLLAAYLFLVQAYIPRARASSRRRALLR